MQTAVADTLTAVDRLFGQFQATIRDRLWGRLRLLCLLSLNLVRREGFGRAVGDDAVFDKSSNQPMIFTEAIYTRINALRAEIIVTIGTGVAVIVLIGNRMATMIAVNAENTGKRTVRDDGSTGVVGAQGKIPLVLRLRILLFNDFVGLTKRVFGLEQCGLFCTLWQRRSRCGGCAAGASLICLCRNWGAQDGFEVAVSSLTLGLMDLRLAGAIGY